jgi:hypothetical protein
VLSDKIRHANQQIHNGTTKVARYQLAIKAYKHAKMMLERTKKRLKVFGETELVCAKLAPDVA